jgi:hypothetical protein
VPSRVSLGEWSWRDPQVICDLDVN